ncbi:MAG: alpha/beta hydrolase [Paucibacter sp.]|nr:alpha/beta hydrolase [Roseateles sp.]
MAGVLERIHRANRPPFHSMTPQEARAAYQLGAEILDLPRAPLPRVHDLELAGRSARLYAPSTETGLPALLYLHGGGFTIGGLETHDSLCRQLALRGNCAVVALDYRLAPEHRFPAAVDDCFSALQHLSARAESLGLDASRIAVGGDSAGGTLAAVSAMQARDAGVDLKLQLLITPGTIAHADTPSHSRFAKGFLLDAENIRWFFGQYIDVDQREDWRFAPLLADDHSDLAPALVLLAEADPLVDEGLAYADRLRSSGVTVELELFRGVTHDFIKMGRMIPEALQALDACGAQLKKAFET